MQQEKIHSVTGNVFQAALASPNMKDAIPKRKKPLFPENNLKKIRLDRGWSREKLAEIAETSQDNVRKIEERERGLSQKWMQKFSTALRCNQEDLLKSHNVASRISDDINEELMIKSAEAITKAVKSNKMNLPILDAVSYTVQLYKHVLEYRRRGEEIDPTESIASLILRYPLSK